MLKPQAPRAIGAFLFLVFAAVLRPGGQVRGQERAGRYPIHPPMPETEYQALVASGPAAVPAILRDMEKVDWMEYKEDESRDFLGEDLTNALRDLYQRRPGEMVTRLNEALLQPSWKVRFGTLDALHKANALNPGLIQGLASAAEDAEREVRIRAVTFLSFIPDKAIGPPLTRALQREPDQVIASRAAEGLARQGDPLGTEFLLGHLRHADWHVREEAADGLAIVKTKRVREALERAIRTEKNTVVQGAIIAALYQHTGISQEKLRKKYLGRIF